ncbi:MAG: cellulose biosynthesis cyclic di-GMP-binding regulatory protein BcsB [Chloroflexi bacterium]|nr:cellulose biosynthesis cyclic di-GMP-binding regulatory protein BcsB [Chloroflexota bacterium]
MNTKAFVTVLVLMMLILSPIRVAADAPSQANLQGGENAVSVTFAGLGYLDSELVGPLDGTRRIFSVPANWQLKPGGSITLDFNVLLTGADVGLVEGKTAAYSGTLTVTFNNKVLGYVRLEAGGNKTATFIIPADAITSIRENGQHELNIQLNAQLDCLYDVRTTVTVLATSRFDMLFDIASPELNLARLPAPFFLRNSLLPDTTLLVVSSQSTAEELQAAMDVMAGFGSLVSRTFNFYLITDDKVTPELLAASHLVFVGMPGKMPMLEQVIFPVTIAGGQFVNLPPESTEDGVLQMAHSPWNPNKVVLLVSGNSGPAVIKAAQAAGSGKIFVHQNPAVSYIRDVQTLAGSLPVVEDFTLADLGYENQQIQGIGIDQIDYTFLAAKEQLTSKEGVVKLVYYHSGLLDYGVSSIAVEINGQIIVSVPFSKETEQITTLEIKIPPGALRFGENTLTVQARMQPNLSCDFSGFSDPWLLVSNQTALHLPVADAAPVATSYRVDLKNFPVMFMKQSDLGDVAFVLAENDPIGWKAAADLAYTLGAISKPSISHLSVAYANAVPEEMRANASLIVVGKASALPIMRELNESLPAPFNLETNTAEEQGMQIVYRVPPGVQVGYLELAASPFNPENLVMVVSGNSDEGVTMAGGSLLSDVLKTQLTGVFAITNGVQVDVSEGLTHFSNVGGSIPGSEQVILTPIATAAPTEQPSANMDGPSWLLPLMIASGVIVIIILSIVALGAIRRNKTLQFDTPAEQEKPDEKK